MNKFPKIRTANILVQELDKELLVYDLNINKAFVLNETSAIIYQLCDGTKTVAQISDLMSQKLKNLVSEDLVWLALNELKRDGLLENTDEWKNPLAGLSRRAMVKKVGLATMVALPTISILTAPLAAQAASCANPGGAQPGVAIYGGCSSPLTTAQCAAICSVAPDATSLCCSGRATAIAGGGCSLASCCVCV